MLNEYAEKNPVYRLKPDELVALGAKVEVEDISAVAAGLLLKLRKETDRLNSVNH